MKKILSLLALVLMSCMGAWAQNYAGTWYLQEASTGQFVTASKVSQWNSELHLDVTGAQFVVEEADDAYTIKYSGRTNNIGGNSNGHGRMYNDCVNNSKYVFEAVEGGVKIKDAQNYYICFDAPSHSLYLKNDVAGSVFRLLSSDQYNNDVVDVTYIVPNLSGNEVAYTMKALLNEKVVSPYLPFLTGGTVSDANKTVTAENKTFHVNNCTWSFPFEQGKYYTMKASNSSYNFVYNGTNAYCNNSTAPALDNDKWSFEHVATSFDLFKVKNEKGGYATVANANNQTLVTFSGTPTQWTSGTGATSYFRITKNSTNLERGFNLQHPGNKQANVGNHVNAGLGVWNPENDNAINNNGSCMLVTEATLTGIDDYKTEVAAVVDAWPLASQAVKDNAKTAINAATDKAGVNTALANGYTAYNTEISTKYYHIKSAYPGYQTKQGVDKAFIAGESKVTWGTFDAASPYQYFQISVTTDGYYNIKSYKVDKYMTATNGTLGASASNNTIFTSLGNGQYNIVVGSGNPCHTEGHSEGAGVSGNLVTWAGSANSCSAWSFVETTEAAYNSANNKTINYTITDAAGTEYEGSYKGGQGELPPFTGVTGHTYNNVVWGGEGNNLTLSANIVFPFAVSSATTHNYVNIGIQANNQKLLFDDNGNVKMSSGVMPNNGNADNYKWEIIPCFDDGTFTFLIKNFNGKYIAGSATTAPGNAFALSEEGTKYAFGNTNINGGRGFYVPDTNYFLSINSPGSTNQNLFIWNKSGNTHTGSNLAFFTPTDFNALMTELSAYKNAIGEGIGKYNTTEENQAKIDAVINGSQFATAAEFTTMKEACIINQPVAGFYYFKGTASKHYMTVDATNANLNTTATNPNVNNVFYLTENKEIIPYARPQYIKVGDGLVVANVAEAGLATEFLGSPTMVGSYNIKVATTTNYFYDWTTYSPSKILVNGERGHNRCQWTLEAVTSLPVNISAARYATLYAPVALTIPAGVNAYTLTVDGNYLVAAVVEGTIAAETAVVLELQEGYEAGSYNFNITTGGSAADNVLEGTIATKAKPEGALVLGLDNEEKVGFYSLNGDTVAGFKAYYVPETSENSNFRIVFDNDTLTSIISAAKENGGQAIFDLQGRRVVKAQNGLFIQNGKKVIK